MKILLLGEKCSLINDYLVSLGHDTYIFTDKLNEENVSGYDFIISFGYRHIIKAEIIDLFPDKIINMHISFLPYNKGADPNLWSYLENSPKGVTIHKIDKGLDTGDIILQKEVQDNIDDTLKTSYDRLIVEIVKLFTDNAENILNNKITAYKQQGTGSMHYLKDKEKYIYLLEKSGYNTPVKDLAGKALL